MTASLPSLKQLRTFEAVARLESISAGASLLRLSQPGVSQAIRNLERRLGVLLFDRRQKGCYRTAAADIFLPRVERLFAQIRQALCEPMIGTPFADGAWVESLETKLTDTQIKSLIAISRSNSFDQAARSLGISEPSLHRSARDLEGILRRTLYRRTAQGFTATPQASELARRFNVAIREIDYGIEELEAARGCIMSRIAIGNIPHSEMNFLSMAINSLLAIYPEASIQIVDGHYDELLESLRGGVIDILYGILRRPDGVKDVDEEFLFRNPYVIVARRDHPITRLPDPTMNDLTRYDWIMPSQGVPRRQAFERMFATSGTTPKICIETTSMDIYKKVLTTSDRLSLFSRREIPTDDDIVLAVVPYPSSILDRRDGVATRIAWKPTKVHLEFLRQLREHSRVHSP